MKGVASGGRSRWDRWKENLLPALNLGLFILALWMVDRVVGEYPWSEIFRALTAIPPTTLALSVLLTLAGYGALVGYDEVAFRKAGRAIPLRSQIVPSFVSFAVSNSAPASVLTAGGLRYRLYRPLGLTPAEAAGVAGFNLVTWFLGVATLAGLLLVTRPFWSPGGVAGWVGGGAGVLLLAITGGYMVACHRRGEAIRFRGRTLTLPDGALARRQFAVSLADWLLSSGALYLLVRSVAPVDYLPFLLAFFGAQTVTLALPVPGGIGVFEAAVLVAIPGGEGVPAVLAALLAYRVIYYLLPLLLAGGLLAVREVAAVRATGQPVRTLAHRVPAAAHSLVAGVTLVAGIVLLTGGAIPADDARLAWMSRLLPLAVLELSHLLASVVGAALLILAWGLQRRIRRAYHLVRLLFGFGIAMALLRSLDVGTAALLLLALVLLLAAGRAFPREVSLLSEPMEGGWAFAVGALLLVNLFVGLKVQQRLGIAGETWWHFALLSHGPRTVRGALGAGVVLLLFALGKLVLGRRPPDATGGPVEG